MGVWRTARSEGRGGVHTGMTACQIIGVDQSRPIWNWKNFSQPQTDPVVWTTGIIKSEAWISHRRSHWKQEELPKAPEGFSTIGSWWSSSDCHQEISVVPFKVLKFEEPLYSILFHSFHLPLSLPLPLLCFSSRVCGPTKVNCIWWSGGGRRGRFARHWVGMCAAQKGIEGIQEGEGGMIKN